MRRELPEFKYVHISDVPLHAHPKVKGISVQRLVSADLDGVTVTCAVVHLPAGSDPERHIHERSDDLLFVLSGQGKFWIDGQDPLALIPGTFIRVPKGVLHAPMEIAEDMVLYNVWAPTIY